MGIKYKDTATGNFKELSVKVGDTLPVGSEVDFNGSVVPTGWEEVDTKDGIELYNNNAGSKTNITLSDNISNYSYLEIFYSNDGGRPNYTKIPLKSELSLTSVPLTITFRVDNGTFRIRTKMVNVIGNEIRVAGYSNIQTTTSYTLATENGDFIAIHKVIGYK